jgi:putative membrane protein
MKLARIAARSTFALLAAGLVTACGGSQPEAQQPVGQSFASETPAPPPPAPVAPPPAAPADQGPSTTAPAAPAEEPLTDEKIAAIIDAANTGEMDQAKIAQKNAKDPKVKAFAAHMITDHGKNMTDSKALLKKIGVTPAESPVSTKLVQGSQELVSKLGGEKGDDFDKDYIDAQVKEHQEVLDMMDTKLLVQVKNADLKAAIQAFRPKVEHHLNDAKAIQATLATK